jgi:hypothetical protein
MGKTTKLIIRKRLRRQYLQIFTPYILKNYLIKEIYFSVPVTSPGDERSYMDDNDSNNSDHTKPVKDIEFALKILYIQSWKLISTLMEPVKR